jgi:vacuolar-type H+-ATPase subunit I/STV1
VDIAIDTTPHCLQDFMASMVLSIVFGIQHVCQCFVVPRWKMGRGHPIQKDALGIFYQVLLWQHILPCFDQGLQED